MTRIARSSALLALPSDASFTPDTFDQVIAILQRRELLSNLSVLCLEKEMRFDPLVSLLQHIGTRSSAKVHAGGQPLKKRLSP